MSHFAKVENGIVTKVIVAEQEVIDSAIFGHGWVQTSYNTHGGVHANGKGDPCVRTTLVLGTHMTNSVMPLYPPAHIQAGR
jgi:hypothetical protein